MNRIIAAIDPYKSVEQIAEDVERITALPEVVAVLKLYETGVDYSYLKRRERNDEP